MKRPFLCIMLFGVFACLTASAQFTACGSETIQIPPGYPSDGCAPHVNDLSPGQFQAKPFIDDCVGVNCDHYGDPDGNIERLYGSYGNNEQTAGGLATTHYNQGVALASKIKPLCTDGTQNCSPDSQAIVFLFLGLSNCTIETCGGNADAFDPTRTAILPPVPRLAGQPCATGCPNPVSGSTSNAWNTAADFVNQESFLYQVYNTLAGPRKVGPHVVIFDGAKGQRTLKYWDPTSIGYWANQTSCDDDPFMGVDPECEYYRVATLLQHNGYSENQVQAVFLRTADSMPQCDLKGAYCNTNLNPPPIPDAYQQEIYLGNILRYLKCCKLDGQHRPTTNPRYPNLQQVFITSQTYDGYANGQGGPNGQSPYTACLLTEPYAYEGAFAVQRMIKAQIDNMPDQYSGTVSYIPVQPDLTNTGSAPWFDWGPYLWISGETPRQFDQRVWCGGGNDQTCHLTSDVRNGDVTDETDYPGDWTHPSAKGLKQVADQLVLFVYGDGTGNVLPSPFVKDWIGK